ncbi:peptidase C39 [Aurantiacibacter aquimixticola]|uniref:Peptidase C39 n=2 Tax=Aurantiacibacter aquimixticola TaxID=1958945 RepID=A0A419RVK0_9SPHN|nr:peptidase C39 [Aurantiacibacter aquimixticola]
MAVLAAAMTLSSCATAPAGPTDIWLGQLTPGAPVVSTQPRSWMEMKFDGLVRQQADFSCGAAVMATIFNHAYGHSTNEHQVLVNMLRIADPDIVRERGFSLLDMKNYAASIGMAAEGYRLDYDQLAEIEIPAIVLIDVRGYKHFVIARRIFGDRIAIGDPALGNRVMTRPQFEEAWNGIAFIVMGDGYEPENSLLDPPPPLSASRLLEATASLPAASAAEYGFAPGYDFTF